LNAERKDGTFVKSEMSIATTTYDGYRKSIHQKLRIKSQMDWSRVLLAIFNWIH